MTVRSNSAYEFFFQIPVNHDRFPDHPPPQLPGAGPAPRLISLGRIDAREAPTAKANGPAPYAYIVYVPQHIGTADTAE